MLVDVLLISLFLLLRLLLPHKTSPFLNYSETNTKYNEESEKEFYIRFSSLHNYIYKHIFNMGCEVTSVYNDQIIGKMGYSQTIVDDLLERDFRQSCLMTEKEINIGGIKNIEGFTQSFAIGKLFFTMAADIQCIVYSAGRFIIIEEVKTKIRKFIAGKDLITAFAVKDKLCLIGVYGGYIQLWDLQFLQVKLQILLPEGSLNISSIGLTSKFIFVTDNSQPNNLAFCYDIRTAKLKWFTKIPTLQPTVRGVSVGQNTHIVSCADGIWFISVMKNPEQLSVTRGIFGQYPKTSIAYLQQANNYLIGGGVDGYIYVWKISTMKCTKALKAHDGQITAIAVKNNYVILSCMNGRTKVYTYKVTKQQKKKNEPTLDQQEEDQRNKQEDQFIITFILVDTYDKQGSVFAIAVSQKDPYLYYCQTRQGLMFQKRLPVTNMVQSKDTLKAIVNQDIQRYNQKSKPELYKNKIYSIYLMADKIICVDTHKIIKDKLELQEERVVRLQQPVQPQHMALLIDYNQIVYLTKSNKIMVAQSFQKIGDAFSNANKSNFGLNTKQILNIQQEKFRNMNFILFQQKPLLVITTNQSIFIFQRESKLNYQERQHKKYQKQIPTPITIQSLVLVYDQKSQVWREEKQTWKSFTQEEKQQQKKLHCGKTNSCDSRWNQLKISLGKGFCIFYK